MSIYFCADCKSKMAVAALQRFRIGSYGKTNESEAKNLLEPKHQLSMDGPFIFVQLEIQVICNHWTLCEKYLANYSYLKPQNHFIFYLTKPILILLYLLYLTNQF